MCGLDIICMYLFIIYVKIEGRINMHLLEFLTVKKKEKKLGMTEKW